MRIFFVCPLYPGADLGGGCRGFIGVEVEQETSAPPPKKNPGSTPDIIPGLTKKLEVVKSEKTEKIWTCQ